MHYYHPHLKKFSRQLRKDMTDSERHLWHRLSAKQLFGITFYRQKPIGPYIVDFYAPKANLIIEIDGSQHFVTRGKLNDCFRDRYLRRLGFVVMRFDNLQVLQETDAVMQKIYDYLNWILK